MRWLALLCRLIVGGFYGYTAGSVALMPLPAADRAVALAFLAVGVVVLWGIGRAFWRLALPAVEHSPGCWYSVRCLGHFEDGGRGWWRH
jgi:hypothetical protein